MARKLIVEIAGDTRQLEKSYDRAEKSTRSFGKTTQSSLGKVSVGVGQLVKGTVIVGGITKAFQSLDSAMHAGVDEWIDQQKVAAQTGAVLKSTGGAAGVTAKQVDELAASISRYSGMDDEAIQAGENMLLTFVQIRDAAGENNDIFTQATKAAADLSQAMGIDMTRAALQVGKALNDPARGYARLQRIGVAFSKQQVAQIKNFTATGRVADAQRVILAELTKEFGGSAKAFGETMPGQIKRFQESLRNLGGELVGAVAPAFTHVLDGMNNFISKLEEAHTVRAKLAVVWEGLQDAGRSLFDGLRNIITQAIAQLRTIDWGNVGAFVQDLVNRVRDAFMQVDWDTLLRNAGAAIGRAWVAELNGLRNLINRVDWQALGKRLVDGIGIAVGALIVFLASVDWKRVIVAIFKFLDAALHAVQGLFRGIGKEIGRLLLDALGLALEQLGQIAKRRMINIVLELIEPFSHLPKRIGGWAQKMKETLNAELAAMEAAGRAGGEAVTKAVGEGMDTGSAKQKPPVVKVPMPELVPDTGAGGGAGGDLGGGAGGAAAAAKKTMTERIQRLNQWWDAAVGRELGRIQERPLNVQLPALQNAAAQIEARIAATKDITRRLSLEDQLLDVVARQKAVKQQLRAQFMDALQFGFEKAGATVGLEDDIRALQRINAALRAQIAEEGRTVENQRALWQNEQQIKALQQQRIANIRAIAEQKFQTKIDWLEFGVERATATGSLNKAIATEREIIRLLETQIKESGRTLDRARKLAQNRDALKSLLDKKKNLRSAATDVADVASTKISTRDPSGGAYGGGFGTGTNPYGGAVMLDPRGGYPGTGAPRSITPTMTTAPSAVGRPFGAFGGGVNIGNLNLYGVQNVPQLENELESRAYQRPQPRRG